MNGILEMILLIALLLVAVVMEEEVGITMGEEALELV